MIDKQKAQELNINIIDNTEVKNELFAYLKEHFPQSISENTPNLKAIATLLELNDNIANMQG